MSLLRQLSVLAMCQVLGDRADSLMGFLGERFKDHSLRLEGALGKASERAWRCLEVALAGDSFWDSCKSLLTPKDEQALQQQIRQFLTSLPANDLPADAGAFRKLALAELKTARKVGLIPGGEVKAQEVADDHARLFGRYGDPQSLLRRDRELLDGLAGVLHRDGYANLARYVSLRPADGQPLLVQAVRYFFRREVEADPRLATGLTMEKLDGLDAGLKAGFDDLHSALVGHESKLTATLEVVTTTHDDVKTLRAQMEQQHEELRQLTALLKQLLPQAKAPPEEPAKLPAPARGPFAGGSPLDQHATEWTQLREVLGWAQRLPPQRPEVTRVLDRLTETARQVESKRRTILHLEHAESGEDPLPILDALPVEEPPPRPRAKGRVISPLFQQADPPATNAPRAPNLPTAPPPRRRLLSPLFDPKPEPQEPDTEKP